MFRYLVLGLLRDGAVHHGYALMKDYLARAGQQVNTGSFYRELSRLVAEGLAEYAAYPVDADGRRTPYRITETGRAYFDEWMLAAPAGIGDYDDALSGRTVFLEWTTPEVVRGMFDRWRDLLWLRSKTVEGTRERLLLPRPQDKGAPFQPLSILLARQLKHIAADLEYLDELRGAYEGWVANRKQRVAPETLRATPAPHRVLMARRRSNRP